MSICSVRRQTPSLNDRGSHCSWSQQPDPVAPLNTDEGSVLSVGRALISLASGVVDGVVVAVLGAPELAPVAGWTAAATLALIWVWRVIWPQDSLGTKRLAEEEGHSRTTDTAVLVAAVASLAAVALALLLSNYHRGGIRIAGVLLSIIAVILAWALVNTVYALKYARLYFYDEDGGIDFKQDAPPAYSDFAYLAFTVGMAFAASETEPTSTAIRKAALGHALLSYILGTGILAAVVNIVANLGQG